MNWTTWVANWGGSVPTTVSTGGSTEMSTVMTAGASLPIAQRVFSSVGQRASACTIPAWV